MGTAVAGIERRLDMQEEAERVPAEWAALADRWSRPVAASYHSRRCYILPVALAAVARLDRSRRPSRHLCHCAPFRASGSAC